MITLLCLYLVIGIIGCITINAFREGILTTVLVLLFWPLIAIAGILVFVFGFIYLAIGEIIDKLK